jgi:hypothetical protein
MNDQNNEFTAAEDAIVREKLGELYAAPADPGYWSELQVRILSRIADSDPGLWWVFLGRWARVGIVAAALALIVAGIASVATERAENQLAYQRVLMPTTPVTTLERVSATAGLSEDEAALRYVLSLIEGQGR